MARRNRLDVLLRVLGTLPEPGAVDPDQLAQQLGTTRSGALRELRDARDAAALAALRERAL